MAVTSARVGVKQKADGGKSDEPRPGMHGDGNGLWLRVVTAERRSWAFRYQCRGKGREMGLGGFPAVSLAAGRDKAEAARKRLAAGIDPIDQREAERQARAAEQAHATTFAEAATAYIEANRSGWCSGKTETQSRNTLAIHAEPILGKLACNSIETDDVLKVLKPETATRARRRIEAVLFPTPRCADGAVARTQRHGAPTWHSCCPPAARSRRLSIIPPSIGTTRRPSWRQHARASPRGPWSLPY
jgi:hypothetical protein